MFVFDQGHLSSCLRAANFMMRALTLVTCELVGRYLLGWVMVCASLLLIRKWDFLSRCDSWSKQSAKDAAKLTLFSFLGDGTGEGLERRGLALLWMFKQIPSCHLRNHSGIAICRGIFHTLSSIPCLCCLRTVFIFTLWSVNMLLSFGEQDSSNNPFAWVLLSGPWHFFCLFLLGALGTCEVALSSSMGFSKVSQI